MRLTFDSTGTVLASLALSLQIAVCALGGRLCYRVAPIVEPAVETCAGGCCGERDVEKDRYPLGELVAAAPLQAPGTSDCCLESSEEYFLQGAVPAKLLPPPLTGAVAGASIAPTTIGPEDTRWQPPPLEPPGLRLLRATILLL